MKKWFVLPIIALLAFVTLAAALNIKVSTQRGVSYKWTTIKIPLYLKILDFFDRHYNYRELVNRIVSGAQTDEERLLKILKWSHDNMNKAPEGLPVIDDHVWHIIVRGYGVRDQFSDVFTTLCNYAHLDAFYANVSLQDSERSVPFSFIKVGQKWTVVDPYFSAYFTDADSNLVNIREFGAADTWTLESLNENVNFDYKPYYYTLSLVRPSELHRANVQSPVNRLRFELQKCLNK
ncbi:MAG: transglutaminase domain-containing protein [Candidatus Omnitrophica bacterium]|nr:transglutaminase domain-containing protein [Candidatus Omnitrophota bacterium]